MSFSLRFFALFTTVVLFFARVVSVDAKHAGSVINGFCE